MLEASDINIEQNQFGLYNLKGHITPKKDFDYLEARIVFYDSDRVVVGKSSCAWNIRSAKSGETLSSIIMKPLRTIQIIKVVIPIIRLLKLQLLLHKIPMLAMMSQLMSNLQIHTVAYDTVITIA